VYPVASRTKARNCTIASLSNLHRYALSIARVHQIACDAVQGAFLRYFIERRYAAHDRPLVA